VEEVKKVFVREREKWDGELQEARKEGDGCRDRVVELERDLRKAKNELSGLRAELEGTREENRRLLAQR